MSVDDYEAKTRRHYQDPKVAQAYNRELTCRLSLQWIVTWAERRGVRILLSGILPEVRRAADVPCGSGKLLPVFAALAVPVFGGDVSAAMLQIARRVATQVGGPTSLFTRLDATRLPFGSGTLDAVVCLRLLHRVPEDVKRAILTELSRVTVRYAIVSYGVMTTWQRVRYAARRAVTGLRTVPYPLLDREIPHFFAALGWSIKERRPVIPFLSGEELALLVKH